MGYCLDPHEGIEARTALLVYADGVSTWNPALANEIEAAVLSVETVNAAKVVADRLFGGCFICGRINVHPVACPWGFAQRLGAALGMNVRYEASSVALERELIRVLDAVDRMKARGVVR